MEVLSPQNQSSDDWHSSSLDESWDSRLPTPLALDFSAEEEDFAPYTNGGSEDLYINNGYTDSPVSPASPASNHELQTEYLKMARKGGGHSDLLKIEPNTLATEPVKYDKKDGQWYTHNGVDVQDTQQRKEMVTVPNTPRSSNQDSSVDVELDTNYLKMAKKGGGHKDLLMVEPHTPTPEPVKYDKKDGQWYTHDGVDVEDTQQRKEMVTVPKSPRSSNADSSVDIELDTDYLKIAKKGGGRKDLLTVTPHTPTPEPVTYDKTDGQWYTHDGVDVKETQSRKDLSLDITDTLNNNDSISAAGGKPTEYLSLAKKGGGHQDLLTVKDHIPSPEPQKYEKKGGEWYNQDDMVIKNGPQDTGEVKKRHRTYSDSTANCTAETEYLRTARLGGGHKDLLTVEPHTPTPEPVQYDKKDGQWYGHDGVDVKDTQERKEMVTLPNSPRKSTAGNSVIDIETDTDYLKIAKKGGGHKDLLSIEHHTPTPEKVTYDKTDGQWYTHDGVDVKETQQRLDLSASINGSESSDVTAAGANCGEYLKLAKKGGGHDDLLTLTPHTPTPEPVRYDKKDGQWYTHDGVDVKDTQSRKEMVTVAASPRPPSADSSIEINTDTEYLQIAKKGGGHKDLLTIDHHTPTPEKVTYDKTDGQWYAHDGVDIRETQSRKETMVSVDKQKNVEHVVAAGGNNTEYLDLAKKGGGHKDLLTIDHHTPTPEPVTYDKRDGQWYSHDGVDIKETQQRKETMVSVDKQKNVENLVAAGGNNTDYLQLAKKGGGHHDLLTIEHHTPTQEKVTYDKTDGQWYGHDGVDIRETQSRRDLSSTLESIPEDLPAAGEKKGEYLEVARKGGHKDLLTLMPHTPTPEPVSYDKKDGQWYTHDGVDVKETQSRREMVTVASSPRPSSAAEVETDTEYLKTARKGGGHKDLLTVTPHTPTSEPVKVDKTDGQWYTHDGVDVKETQSRKEMVTVVSSPRSPSAAGSADTPTETDYLKIAKKGGGHKDLLVIEPNTPRSEPVKYDKKDGHWYTHDGVDVKDTQQRKEMVTVCSNSPRKSTSGGHEATPSPRADKSDDSDYLKLARKGGGHNDLLTMTPHTPTPEPVRYNKKDGQWYTHDGVDVKETQSRKDLLSHTPSPEPRRSEKKTDNQDHVDGDKSKGRKGSPASSSPRDINTDTDYLKTARKGGGHKDLLTIEHHKPSSKPKKQEKRLGDWYYHDQTAGKDSAKTKDSPSPSPISSPRKSTSDSLQSSDYLRMARKGGGHKDLLCMTPQSTSTPKPKEVKQNGEPSIRDSPFRRSASMRVTSKNTGSDYLNTARKGGHHKDLLTMPDTETSNFRRDQASRRSLRSFRSPLASQIDGPPRPRTAEPRQSNPIWLGGSGPERVHNPGKRFINQSSVIAPFAYHHGSPGAAKNPDKI
ncbi:uncharacterized protein [Porites lutea]|uniref:uncharacterized protein isoform X4 n=1 Tax=Porites lutea TaxID=51062 RepID=UPI003CC6761E